MSQKQNFVTALKMTLDHSFSTYANFSQKLHPLPPNAQYAYLGASKTSFSGNFVYALN